ncbi:cadherin-related family member 4 isoform X3 [Ahaetulla prasina]|uniref:cadherin-related family member 4 isoform X3 n=1 Tax=Ahaetulla prasina TaxID=499056 RepID=UPI002648B984|nr:cadherin-related family member 4 isoform X3 [Ahaetulla prasina]
MQRLGLVEWDRPSFLFLLFIAWAIDPDIGAEAIEFRDLPKTVELEETAEPNSVVTTFSVSCTNTSDVPEISLKTVTPVSSFFEHLILSAGNYQVRLSPSAALDARVVNLYALTFTANCTGETKDAQLFVQVNETKRLVCNEGYTDIGRLPIQVSEDARPGETIYTTVLKRRGTGKLTFTVENSSLPFVVTSEGVLQVPATGFTREQAGKTFSLKIVIKDATSISCEVPLSIQVNPVYHNKVSFRTEVPEDFLIGSTILPLSCYDPENINSSLTYNIVNQDPPYSFKMDGPNFQVNSSLDCDSESMATRNFQYNAAILVIDEGSPAQTTTVSVLVTVRQVNEFLPKCSKWVFYVPENTEYGYSIGNVNGSDQDYPFNNIEYSIMDGDARVFYINSHTGQLHVLLPLDFEDQKVYHLAVILKDLENEAAPGTQKTTRCNVTIFVQDVNDRPPKCKKPFFVYSIYSTQATDIEITDINCEDEDRGNELTYNIARGNVNGRFHMVGNKLFHNTFSYRPDGIYDPLVFVLLVEVSDGHFSTTVTVVVNVIPWATTVSTTTITTTTTPKKPIVLHRTVTYWAPDPWFVVVLTLTGILFFSALGLLFWQFCRRKSPGEISQSLLQNSSKEVGKNYKVTEEARKQKRKDAIDLQSLEHQFDGRAQDPVSGQYYLFDSSSGARRWV